MNMTRTPDSSNTSFALRTETDRLLSGFRMGLSSRQANHVDNFLRQSIRHVVNSDAGDSFPTSSVMDINRPQRIKRSTSDSGIFLHNINNVENEVFLPVRDVNEKNVFTDFIHNPHKNEMASKLFDEIAFLNLPDFIRSVSSKDRRGDLKSFLGILASQKDSFTDKEKTDFEKICKEFLKAGDNLKKQERVYGMTRELLTKYGRIALENHISYFSMFCVAAWEKYNGLNHRDVHGDDVFRKSINACKENLDSFISKLVDPKKADGVVIRLAAKDFRNGVLAIPLTLKLFDAKKDDNKVKDNEPSPLAPLNPAVEGDGVNQPLKISRDGGDVYFTLNIRDIGNNNGNHSSLGVGNDFEPYSFQLIKDLLNSGLNEDNKANLIHHILKLTSGAETATSGVNAGRGVAGSEADADAAAARRV
ncbi:hypothetical protein GPM36_004712, partial [Salmonella enterica]|nr:hypothetical protein [Salmonella enterica]